jgi:hypothetical protein
MGCFWELSQNEFFEMQVFKVQDKYSSMFFRIVHFLHYFLFCYLSLRYLFDRQFWVTFIKKYVLFLFDMFLRDEWTFEWRDVYISIFDYFVYIFFIKHSMFFVILIELNWALFYSPTPTIFIINCGFPFLKEVLIDSNMKILFHYRFVCYLLVLRYFN